MNSATITVKTVAIAPTTIRVLQKKREKNHETINNIKKSAQSQPSGSNRLEMVV
jgi:hypothetical protein